MTFKEADKESLNIASSGKREMESGGTPGYEPEPCSHMYDRGLCHACKAMAFATFMLGNLATVQAAANLNK